MMDNFDSFSIGDTNERKRKITGKHKSPGSNDQSSSSEDKEEGSSNFSVSTGSPNMHRKGTVSWQSMPGRGYQRKNASPSQIVLAPPAAESSQKEEDEEGIGEYLRIYGTVLLRYKMVILLITAIVFVLSIFHTLRKADVYSSRAVMQKTNESMSDAIDPLLYDWWNIKKGSETTKLETLAHLAYSDDMLERTRKVIRDTIPHLKEGTVPPLKSAFAENSTVISLKEIVPRLEDSPEKKEKIIEYLSEITTSQISSIVQVRKPKDDPLLQVKAYHSSPLLASLLANAMVQAILEYSIEVKRRGGVNATNYLSKVLKEKKTELARLRRKIIEKQKEKLRQGDTMATIPQKGRFLLKMLEKSQTDLAEAKLDLSSVKQKIILLKERVKAEEPTIDFSVIEQNPIQKRYKELKIELELAQTKYTSEHPKVKSIKEKIESLKKLDKIGGKDSSPVQKEIRVNTLRNSLLRQLSIEQAIKQGLEEKIQSIEKKSDELNQQLLALPLKNQELDRYYQEKKTLESLIEKMTDQLERARLMVMRAEPDVTVASFAHVPQSPMGPNRKLSYLMGIVLGLILGIGLAFLLDSMDNTFKDPDGVRKNLKLKCLGEVPVFESEERHINIDDPKSRVSETFALLRNSIRYSAKNEPENLLLVASAFQAEGKSLISTNLGISYALEGSRTLVIEMDFRKPDESEVKEVVELEADSELVYGLSDFLQNDEIGLEDIVYTTDVEHLYVMPQGLSEDYSPRWFRSAKFQQMLREVSNQFEVVIIDSAAVLPVVDATLIAPYVKGVLLVIEAENTPVKAVQKAIDRFESVNGSILGVVLNKMKDYSFPDYYYYYTTGSK